MHAAYVIGDDLAKYLPNHDEIQYLKFVRWIFDFQRNFSRPSVTILDEKFRYEQAAGIRQWSDRPWKMVVTLLVHKTGQNESDKAEKPEQTVCLNFNREKGCSFKHWQ
jgi:hypothetical protein